MNLERTMGMKTRTDEDEDEEEDVITQFEAANGQTNKRCHTYFTRAMEAGRALAGVFVLLVVAMPMPRPGSMIPGGLFSLTGGGISC